MEFVIIGYDGKDSEAMNRRLAVREAHLKNADKMYEEGKLLFASALLDENEKMNGSIMFCDFPSREAIDEEWLKTEPYIIGKVWEKVIIKRAKIAKH
ncbi:MAG: hypothetical protein KKF62_00780 [Bacteroidetes bacterium]|nr:hypothetical protein [Bacteroidota bacterium]MBU1114274.1 hypothetical protein [Bacteroidota bacterium]MBU1797662.1 hypothetical protein [Bacteroidota bacterium]